MLIQHLNIYSTITSEKEVDHINSKYRELNPSDYDLPYSLTLIWRVWKYISLSMYFFMVDVGIVEFPAPPGLITWDANIHNYKLAVEKLENNPSINYCLVQHRSHGVITQGIFVVRNTRRLEKFIVGNKYRIMRTKWTTPEATR